MPRLDPYNRSRCAFHLGYGNRQGIPAGDVARLEEAMNQVYDNYQANRIQQILTLCDTAFAKVTGLNEQFQEVELIAGDINRSVQRGKTSGNFVANYQQYVNVTDLLAQELWVPNYRQEMNLRYRFERSGAEYIKAIPGIADTAVGSSIAEINRTGGGFGLPAF